jgi:hypothetical protein
VDSQIVPAMLPMIKTESRTMARLTDEKNLKTRRRTRSGNDRATAAEAEGEVRGAGAGETGGMRTDK